MYCTVYKLRFILNSISEISEVLYLRRFDININSLNLYQGQASNYSSKPSNQTSKFIEILKSKSKEPIR